MASQGAAEQAGDPASARLEGRVGRPAAVLPQLTSGFSSYQRSQTKGVFENLPCAQCCAITDLLCVLYGAFEIC